MKTVITLILAVCFVLTPSVCKATIGDTEDQCTARYGKPSDSGTFPTGIRYATYKITGYTIFVKFLNGVSGQELISKDNSDFTDSDISSVLQLESGGSQWKVLFAKYQWERADRAEASLDGGGFDIESKAWSEHFKE